MVETVPLSVNNLTDDAQYEVPDCAKRFSLFVINCAKENLTIYGHFGIGSKFQRKPLILGKQREKTNINGKC